ncbi:hypothetical protein DH2020_047382 [Rehmannia glutinosa]|uniref:CCHC-type domain-containing protein n=1 Tax=Rehmannia glutinosa TaxID=99300 RepID=A0ABR0U989_REHGL
MVLLIRGRDVGVSGYFDFKFSPNHHFSLQNLLEKDERKPEPCAALTFQAFLILKAGSNEWLHCFQSGTLQNNLCNNCKRPGHFARECPNVAVCNNCGLPGHIASECTSKALCWNCREPGHTASNCPNEGLCHSCGKSGHRARDCPNAELSPGDLRLCNNCLKPGHLAAECTNGMACKNCRKTGHIARDCQNDPVCNSCNISGHVARQCPKGDFLGERGQGGGTRYGGGYRDMVCGTVTSLVT